MNSVFTTVLNFLSEYRTDLLIIGGLVIAWLLLSTRPTQLAPGELDTLTRSGEPTVLYFYSNRCPQCLAAKPLMETLENRLDGTAGIVHLSVTDKEIGLPAAWSYGVRATPTTIVIDGCGTLLGLYEGLPPTGKIAEAVENASTCEAETQAR